MIAMVVLTVFLNGKPVDEQKIETPRAWEVCEILRDNINEGRIYEARCTKGQ